MPTMSISKDLGLTFLGRNGDGRMCGVEIFAYNHILDIRPITSRGVTGRCSIPIPVEQLGSFLETLQAAARELRPPSPSDKTPEPAETEGSEATAQLIARFGAWGEDPIHPREDWQYLVANGDTQRGYWEHVAACIEQERDDQLLSADAENLGS